MDTANLDRARAVRSRYNSHMRRQHRYYCLNDLRFITASTYRRARLFDSECFRRHFLATLTEISRTHARNRRVCATRAIMAFRSKK